MCMCLCVCVLGGGVACSIGSCTCRQLARAGSASCCMQRQVPTRRTAVMQEPLMACKCMWNT